MENKYSYIRKAKNFIISHKGWSILVVVVFVFVGWQIYKKVTSTDGQVSYVTSKVVKGDLFSSVSASGQVEATSQLDLKPQAGGQITYVGVKPGEEVKRGKLLFGLNAKTAQKAVRNAETSLESAKLELEKLTRVPDTVEVLAIKQDIRNSEQSKVEAHKDVDKAYRDLLNTSTSAVSSVLGNTQTAPTITGTYIKDKEAIISISVYQTGNGSYFNASSSPVGVVNANGVVSTTVAQPLGDSGLYIKFASNIEQPTWTISLPNKSVALYETNNKAYEDALVEQQKINETADLEILQKNQELNDLYQPDEFELRAKELAVRQAEDNLKSAKADLADYYVYAPFDGVIASVNVRVGESNSGVFGTLVTNQKIASLSLNEVDVAKVNIGQKAEVSFDAIEGLSVSGEVVEIDTLGTVTQGVVSYVVKVALATEDIRIKPGMSISANIVTDSKEGVLYIPSSAVKNRNGNNYVEMFEIPLVEMRGSMPVVSKDKPKQIPVDIGISDDTNTEIVSGLKEGDQIISRTITAKTTTNTQAPSLFGGAGGGGGSTRALTR